MGPAVAVVDDDLDRARGAGAADRRALGVGGAGMVGERPVLAFPVQVPTAEAVRDDVEGRGGRHASIIASRAHPLIRKRPQIGRTSASSSQSY
jgi:hypothetical protein